MVLGFMHTLPVDCCLTEEKLLGTERGRRASGFADSRARNTEGRMLWAFFKQSSGFQRCLLPSGVGFAVVAAVEFGRKSLPGCLCKPRCAVGYAEEVFSVISRALRVNGGFLLDWIVLVLATMCNDSSNHMNVAV